MELRQAYEMVIENEINIMIEEKGAKIPKRKVKELVKYLSNNYEFLQDISGAIEDSLEDYCENIDIFDIWD
ncbi:hypothetical protein ACFYKT_16595 [Cytobacillus sp. FJAT-53684]|uniref:Uncharacterized protein n=1 Tax=Cytobacillus mangrovibacter TaxID=3299024 RepID=A0ABW6K1D0_9BACI